MFEKLSDSYVWGYAAGVRKARDLALNKYSDVLKGLMDESAALSALLDQLVDEDERAEQEREQRHAELMRRIEELLTK